MVPERVYGDFLDAQAVACVDVFGDELEIVSDPSCAVQ